MLLLKKLGHCGLIIPNAWLMVDSAKNLRKYLLGTSDIKQIVNLLGVSFEGVSVETVIFIAKKERLRQNMIQILLNKEKNFEHSHSRNQNDFLNNEGYEFRVFSDEKSKQLIAKMQQDSLLLDQLTTIKAGLQAYETGKGIPKQTPDDVKKRPYDFRHKYDRDTYEYLEGKDVGRYFINWSGEYLKYGDNLAAPRTFDIFNHPKIIVREIPGSAPKLIIATYTEKTYLFNRSNIAILEKEGADTSLKYILAIINSNLLSYYFLKNTAKSIRKLFPKLILNDLRKFPIKRISEIKQLSFISLVDQILALNERLIGVSDQNSNEAQTLNVEIEKTDAEIDRLVYELYGLTEEEIKIVEQAVK